MSNIDNPIGGNLYGNPNYGVVEPIGFSFAQPFATGADTFELKGATLALDRGISGGLQGEFTVSLHADNGGVPGAQLLSLNGPVDPYPFGYYDYTTGIPSLLAPHTSYWIVAEVPQHPPVKSVEWFTTPDTGETGLPGWTIGNNSYIKVFDGGVVRTDWAPTQLGPLRMSIFGEVAPDSGATAILLGLGSVTAVSLRRVCARRGGIA